MLQPEAAGLLRAVVVGLRWKRGAPVSAGEGGGVLRDPWWGARCGVGTWVVGSGVGWKPPAWKSRCVVERLSMGARGGDISSSSSCL